MISKIHKIKRGKIMMIVCNVFRLEYFVMILISVGIANKFLNCNTGNFRNKFKYVYKSLLCCSFVDDISLRLPPKGIFFLFLFISWFNQKCETITSFSVFPFNEKMLNYLLPHFCFKNSSKCSNPFPPIKGATFCSSFVL